jgi:hypothetical protein
MDFYSFSKNRLGFLSDMTFHLFWIGRYEECFNILDRNAKEIGVSNLGMLDLLIWHHCGLRLGKQMWNDELTIPEAPNAKEILSLYTYQLSRENRSIKKGAFTKGILFQPSVLDKAVLAAYIGLSHGCDEVIETGTFLGGSSYIFSGPFTHVSTIEADEDLHESASSWLSKFTNNVRCFLGNSSQVLPQILPTLSSGKKLFFLDAHYSGGPTSSSYGNCPLMDELIYVTEMVQDYVIVVDDAREMGKTGFPTFEEIFRCVPRGRTCQIEHDQIIIY